MNRHLRITLILRLLLAWGLLSLLIGAAVFLLETRRIDGYVVELATRESHGFLVGNQDDFNGPDPLRLEHLRRESQRHIDASHFIAIQLADRHGKKILSTESPDIMAVADQVATHRQASPPDGTVHSRTFYGDDGQIYVLVAMPLTRADGQTAGYFEGIYKVPPQTMAELKQRILLSLLQVVVIIFFTTLLIYPLVLTLNRGLIQRSEELARANIETLRVLGGAIAKRDSDTHFHNHRVTLYAVRLAEQSGFNGRGIASIIKGSFLHDVGKIAISDLILLKPGTLSVEERQIMQTHVQHGMDILGRDGWLGDSLEIVRCHHERFDGTGYPAGLRGKEIPTAARIFALVDVFDALSSRRPYKDPFPLDRAVQILREGSGSAFDPALVQRFVGMAAPLYAAIGQAEGPELEAELADYIDRYFSPERDEKFRLLGRDRRDAERKDDGKPRRSGRVPALARGTEESA